MISLKKFNSRFENELQGSLDGSSLYSVLSFCNSSGLETLVSIGFSGKPMDSYFGSVSFRDDGLVVVDCADGESVLISPSEIVSITVGVGA